MIDDNRSCQIDLIEKNIGTTTGIVILAPYEIGIDHIPENEQNRLRSISYKNKIPIYIITSLDHSVPSFLSNDEEWKYTKIIRWPLFWLSQTLHDFIHSNDFNKKNGCDVYVTGPNLCEFQHTFICMNRNPKLHRYQVMDLLAKYNLIDNNAVSFRLSYIPRGNNIHCNYWTPRQLLLDQEDVDDSKFDQRLLPKQYNKSFMQLVTESDHESFFLTEKTATPLIFGKPFLVASNKGYHHRLRDFGFRLYNEIFDYSFDLIDDNIQRYDNLIQNIIKYNSYSKKELLEIYKSIKYKIIYNRNLAIQIACDTKNFPVEWNHFKLAMNDVEFFQGRWES